MPKISVIVPIYNVERYLDRSIRSIMKQTLEDIEIILIDDGSEDSSLTICEKYQQIDSRIKVFSKVNGGVSSARNLGIEKSKGKYLAFIDPDDWIETKMLESLYLNCNNNSSEVALCNYIVESGKKKKESIIDYDAEVFNREAILDFLIPNMIGEKLLLGNKTKPLSIMGSVCRLLIKKDLLREYNITFKEDLGLMEDLIFCLELFIQCEKISYDKSVHYHYMKNNQSALTSYRKNTMLERKNIMEYMKSLFEKYNIIKKYEERFKYRYVRMAIVSIINETKTDNEKHLFRKIQTIREICKDKQLQEYLNEVKHDNHKIKTNILIFLMKYKQAFVLYLYYKIKKT